MGFFDDLVLPEEPAGERPVLMRLGPLGEQGGRYGPPVDWYAPVTLSQLAVAGVGAEVRVVLVGWSVWPGAVTVRLAVFHRVRRGGDGGPRQSGLRVGMRFADGRRVTSLDGTVQRGVRFTGPQGEEREAAAQQAVGLIPLDPGLGRSHRSLFKTDVELYLPELPPPGEAQLVVEWPDEGVAETRTAIDVAALHDAAERALEVWPGLEPPDPAGQPRGAFAHAVGSGPPGFLAPPLSRPQRDELRRQEEERQRYVPQADWERLRFQDWGDAALIRARLEGGADADARVGWRGTTPLHLAAEQGSAQAVVALLPHVARVDAADDDAHTALWFAACAGDEGCVRALVEAGADVWTPQTGLWSPGRLLLTTPLAPLVAQLAGAVALPEQEAAAFRAADALIAAFGERELWTEGLGIAFVRDVGEDELIRRLGADPAQCPPAGEPPFDPADYEASLRYVGVAALAGDPGGSVLTQDGFLPSGAPILRAISVGTTAYGLYFNPKGGRFGTLARDGEAVEHEEIGLRADASDPPAYWHFRFWQTRRSFPYGADTLAYACAAAGLRITDGREAVDRSARRRWVELPEGLRR